MNDIGCTFYDRSIHIQGCNLIIEYKKTSQVGYELLIK